MNSPLTSAERRKCEALLAKGLSYPQIAAHVGRSYKAVRCHLDPRFLQRVRELNRESRERNRENRRAYDRVYAATHRAKCPKCGHEYGAGSGIAHVLNRPGAFTNCPDCAERRRQQIVQLWNDGSSMPEICSHLGITKSHLSVEMVRMREAGYYLPYRYRGSVNGTKFPHLRKAAP